MQSAHVLIKRPSVGLLAAIVEKAEIPPHIKAAILALLSTIGGAR